VWITASGGGERKGGKEEGKDSKEEVREGRQTGGKS